MEPSFSSIFHLFALIACVKQFVLQAQAFPHHATVISRDLANATKSYDFIIAGGGIAGLTLADRLTEDPDGINTPAELMAGPSRRL